MERFKTSKTFEDIKNALENGWDEDSPIYVRSFNTGLSSQPRKSRFMDVGKFYKFVERKYKQGYRLFRIAHIEGGFVRHVFNIHLIDEESLISITVSMLRGRKDF